MPVCYPAYAGQSYRPSNGTEGMIFEEKFCDHCTRFSAECEIYSAALLYEKEHALYPSEWIYDATGRPTCTAFCDRNGSQVADA